MKENNIYRHADCKGSFIAGGGELLYCKLVKLFELKVMTGLIPKQRVPSSKTWPKTGKFANG